MINSFFGGKSFLLMVYAIMVVASKPVATPTTVRSTDMLKALARLPMKR